MKRYWASAVAAVGALLLALSASGQEPPPHSGLSRDAQIAQWIDDLDHENFDRREQATRELASAGFAAIEPLAAAAAGDNAEIAWRACTALEQIGTEGNEQTLAKVSAALLKLSAGGRPELASVVKEMRARQLRQRYDRAVGQFKALGGETGDPNQPPDGMTVAAVGFDDLVAVDITPVELAALDPFGVVDVEVKAEPPAIDDAPPAPEPADVAPPPDEAPGEPTEQEVADVAPPPDEPPPATEPADLILLDEPIAMDGPVPPGVAAIADAYGSDLPPEYTVPSITLGKNWRGGDAGLSVLRDLPGLAQINIEGAQLTDAAVAQLARLPKLTTIHIRGTRLSAEAMLKLRAQRPGLNILAVGDALLGVSASIDASPCVIESVFPDSAARAAGLQEGDCITKIDGVPIAGFSDLMICIYAHQPGDKVRVEFNRGGKAQSATVQLKARQLR